MEPTFSRTKIKMASHLLPGGHVEFIEFNHAADGSRQEAGSIAATSCGLSPSPMQLRDRPSSPIVTVIDPIEPTRGPTPWSEPLRRTPGAGGTTRPSNARGVTP